MALKCGKHPKVDAYWEVSMYERANEDHPAPQRLWTTLVCEACMEANRGVLKMNGPRFLLLLIRVPRPLGEKK